MGCLYSQDKPLSSSVSSNRYKPSVTNQGVVLDEKLVDSDNWSSIQPNLTESEIQLVRDSWDNLHSDIVSVGVVMFTRLFETHPDVQDTFMDFRNMTIEDIRHSKTLREHGLRVMTTVEKVLARIDDPDKLDGFIQQLGAKHVTYRANINYIQLVGPQFVRSIKSELEDVWTEETEAAWYKLFDYITFFMKKGMVSLGT